MKIAVWRTNHEISCTVHDAIVEGLRGHDVESCDTCEGIQIKAVGDINIGYGILRGMDRVFRECDRLGKYWFNIDKGYWKPGHYDGYYRISLRGTQQTFGLDKLKPDYERWDKLGLEILPSTVKPLSTDILSEDDGQHLVCPPTEDASKFFGINMRYWLVMNAGQTSNFTFRFKGNKDAIDYNKYQEVITFNSSVGWEALRQGIPVVSDPTHSIVGAYQKMLDIDLSKDSNERRKFFAIQAGLQLRLDEFKQGLLWPLLKRLLDLPQKI